MSSAIPMPSLTSNANGKHSSHQHPNSGYDEDSSKRKEKTKRPPKKRKLVVSEFENVDQTKKDMTVATTHKPEAPPSKVAEDVPRKKVKESDPPSVLSSGENVKKLSAEAGKTAKAASRKKASPFRIKVGCVVALRRDPSGNHVEYMRVDKTDDTTCSTEKHLTDSEQVLPDPSMVHVWVNPQPGRDDGLALIGKRIRCFFSKKIVQKGKRRVMEGEVIRLVDYGKRKPGKVWKVELLVDRGMLQHFSFLTRVDQDVDVSTLPNDKARRNHRNETRIKGGDNKVIVKMRLQHPGSTEQATNCVQWAIQKHVPAKLFYQPAPTTTKAITSQSQAAADVENERGDGALTPTLSEHANNDPKIDAKQQQLPQQLESNVEKPSNGANKRNEGTTETEKAPRKRNRSSSPVPVSQLRHIGDGNDPADQQVANWRWLVSRYHELRNNNDDNISNTTHDIGTFGLVGRVIKVEPPPPDSNLKTLALVTLHRLILPEQTRGGRLPHHDKYEVFQEFKQQSEELKYIVPVEQLLVFGSSLLQGSKGDGDASDWPIVLHVTFSIKSDGVYLPLGQEEEHREQSKPRPTFPVGTLIRRYFEECVEFATGRVTPAGWYQGRITAYDEGRQLYKVEYVDGDQEELHRGEVVDAVRNFHNNVTEKPPKGSSADKGSCVCHRCCRTLPRAKMRICWDSDCVLRKSMPGGNPVAWCPLCVETCHKAEQQGEKDESGADYSELPCCSGMCDCRQCWSRFVAQWDDHFRSHVKEKSRKKSRDGKKDGNDYFGVATSVALSCSGVDFVLDRSNFVDAKGLVAPAPNPIKRVKTKAKTLKSFLRLQEKKSAKDGSESQENTIMVEEEDYSIFKPTCVREFAYDDQRKMKRPFSYGDASQSDVPRNMRELQKSQKKLLTESNPDDKTNASRTARAKQRQLIKGAASLGLGMDTLAGRESQLRFGRSKIHNWGVFADMDIAEGDMIVEYRGEIISNARAEIREKEYERAKLPDYMFRIDRETVCDATKLGNVARFINASCDPNCTAKIITVEGEKRIAVYAKKDIGESDELTYDYKFAFDEDPDKRIPCLCRSVNCRGFLNWDKKYVSEMEIQERSAAQADGDAATKDVEPALTDPGTDEAKKESADEAGIETKNDAQHSPKGEASLTTNS